MGVVANSAERALVVRQPPDEVFAVVRQVLSEVEGLSMKWVDEEIGEIALTGAWSWKSFGERVYVSVESIGRAETRLWLRSKSAFKPTLVDWGKNRENVDTLVKLMKTHLQI